MLTGFKNAVEVDFTLEENKKKIEEAFKQARTCTADHRWKKS
mgnify:CR=1 FL=1